MTPSSDIERRLEALEIKASFTEDMVDQLDQIITRQQLTIDALVAQLRALREQSAQASDGPAQPDARSELPPHY